MKRSDCEVLISAIERSTESHDVLTQSQDYYSERGSFSTSRIVVINPDCLIGYIRDEMEIEDE